MASPTVDILGVPVSRLGMSGAVEACEQRLRDGKGGYVCFVNVHSVTESTENPDLARTFRGSFLNLADGVPLVWTSHLKGTPVEARVCGPDFTTDWLRGHREMTYGFIGGAPRRAEELALKFGVKAVCHSPPIRPFSVKNAKEDWTDFLKLCPEGKAPPVVLIGLGAPKQELWMEVVSPQAPSTLFLGIGAAFDFLTGAIARAPEWMQKAGLEWAFRLAQEPRRLTGRYLQTNTQFLWKVGQSIILGK